MRASRLITSVSLCALFTISSGSALAEQQLKIKVTPGKSSDYHSDMTLESLKDGKTEYTVSGMGKTFKVKLTEQQVEDAMKGTTVMVDSSKNGDSGVRVSITVEGEPESSGW